MIHLPSLRLLIIDFQGKMDCYGAVGALSTVISIILAVVSMVYTFYSGKETSDLFERMDQKLNELDKQIEKIDEQNRAFVDKIKMELSKENYDRANIDNVRNKK